VEWGLIQRIQNVEGQYGDISWLYKKDLTGRFGVEKKFVSAIFVHYTRLSRAKDTRKLAELCTHQGEYMGAQ
jgi:hypothetical protein